MKLWENGAIDVLYRDVPANPGDGRDASIGIEDADGSDALQFSLSNDLLSPNVAYRYEPVPNGVVSGSVIDVNDDLPNERMLWSRRIPGGRKATTGADGTYSLRLRPGYQLSYASEDYITHEEAGVVVTDSKSAIVDVALDAPVAGVEPAVLDASVDFGESSTSTISVSNTGTSDLTWQLFEREGSRTPPDLPRFRWWSGSPCRAPQVPARVRTVRPAALPRTPSRRSSTIRTMTRAAPSRSQRSGGGFDNAEMSIAIDFDLDTPKDQPAGFMYFDTDQDPETGFPPGDFDGLPGQDIGFEFFADLFGIHDPDDPVVLVWDENFELVADCRPPSRAGRCPSRCRSLLSGTTTGTWTSRR